MPAGDAEHAGRDHVGEAQQGDRPLGPFQERLGPAAPKLRSSSSGVTIG
jgi:hypothetical protein